MREPLDSEALHEALVTPGAPWRGLDVHAELGSTNAAAAELAQPWRVVVTDHQSAGRGRLGRSWEAPAGTSIAVSVLLPAPQHGIGWVPLVTGLAVARAVHDVAGVHAGVKWPNDVLVEEDGWRKVCGVLCEVHPAGVVVGFGVNVSQSRDELPVENATSLALCGAPDVRREDLVVACLRHLAVLHGDLMVGGPALEAARAAYRSACRTIGMVVDLNTGTTSRVPATGVDDEGRLVVHGESGEYAVAAGDVVHVREARGLGA
ncbi:biotin--[acetyl-CoA-carboxylase] ligase [Knoellia sp. p5-6-4]|uniref:biotin--[acetyl-CoA-carboxylase] ligase n=1 Tax=unclassified Knoellia TaxID=2618719 RepID=UPI0023DB04A6|nr:biotin--[acetyl-CoA-carboxylase] ligase [Knoellia sp. p5-6-4]MDF2146497.1 biotin--[acetyl-CoA-carboxylase] ligase [Knoellia sp. p5-6-4]